MAVRSRRWSLSLPLCFVTALGTSACGDAGLVATDAASDATAHDAGTDASDASPVLLHEVVLIDHSDWHEYPAEQDPLREHQPSEPIDCGLGGWLVERDLDAVEVDTAWCNYALIEHPALVDVPKGSEVELEFWHYDLIAPEPAVAHAALLFDAELQWEVSVDIPGLANLQRFRFKTTRALRTGEPIRLHVHNHGQNTWMLGEVLAYVP